MCWAVSSFFIQRPVKLTHEPTGLHRLCWDTRLSMDPEPQREQVVAFFSLSTPLVHLIRTSLCASGPWQADWMTPQESGLWLELSSRRPIRGELTALNLRHHCVCFGSEAAGSQIMALWRTGWRNVKLDIWSNEILTKASEREESVWKKHWGMV